MYRDFRSILKFIKENTFLVSLASMILSCLAYSYQVLELQWWGVPLGMVDSMKWQYLVIIVIGILYCFSGSFLQDYLRLKFDLFVPNFVMYRFSYKNFKKIRKVFLATGNDDIKKMADEVSKFYTECKFSLLKVIFSICLFGFLCFFPFFALFFSIVLRMEFWGILILFIMNIISMTVIIYVMCSSEMRHEIKKLKKKIRESDDDTSVFFSVWKEIGEIESRRLEAKKKHYQKSAGSLMNYSVIVLFAVIMFLVSMLSNIYLSRRVDYWVYRDDTSGSDYVSVFETGDALIMKRAEINEDGVEIFLNEQLQIKSIDKKIEHIRFKTVKINNG